MVKLWKMRLFFFLLLAIFAGLTVFCILMNVPSTRRHGTEQRNVPIQSTPATASPREWKASKSVTYPTIAGQTARKSLVKEYCMRVHGSKGALPNARHMLVYQSSKTLYCLMPKCASREIRRVFYHFNVPHAHIRLSTFPIDEQKRIVETFFIFTVVREPFERLVSAYKDKFLYPKPEDHYILKHHGKEILNNFRPNASKRALEELNDITFPEFIQYIVTKGSNETNRAMDWHWDNYENICGMCGLDYDFIAHYETLEEDMAVLKQALHNLTGDSESFNFKQSKASTSSSELLTYFSQIPLEWIKRLGVMYRSNFEMFNYSFPGPLKRLFFSKKT